VSATRLCGGREGTAPIRPARASPIRTDNLHARAFKKKKHFNSHLERLGRAKLVAGGHQARHLGLGQLNLQAAKVGLGDVLDLVLLELCGVGDGEGEGRARGVRGGARASIGREGKKKKISPCAVGVENPVGGARAQCQWVMEHH
jgi:hypothetical protein